jgi:RHS repeat-associated protein
VRDSLGRIEQKTETIQGTTVVWNYSYDSAGRLWQVMQNGMLTATYLYDANGNRLTKTTSSETDTGTYDNQDRLLTYGKWAYTYTANGELQTKTDTTNGAVTTYSYDGQGNLRHVSLPDGRAIDYVVDAENRRVGKKINGALVRRWLYKDTLRPAAEFDGAGNLLAHYVDGLVIKGANTYAVVADHLGTPRLLVDRTSGTVAQRLDFDEFAMVESDTNPGFQVLGFAGGIYDTDTGLVRFGARDYDAAIGRWTGTDPIRFVGADANLYRYVSGDPVNRIDREGTWSTCGAAIAFCLGYAAYQGACKVADMQRIKAKLAENEQQLMSMAEPTANGPNSCQPTCDPSVDSSQLEQEQAELIRDYANAHKFDGLTGHWKDLACWAVVALACLAPG